MLIYYLLNLWAAHLATEQHCLISIATHPFPLSERKPRHVYCSVPPVVTSCLRDPLGTIAFILKKAGEGAAGGGHRASILNWISFPPSLPACPCFVLLEAISKPLSGSPMSRGAVFDLAPWVNKTNHRPHICPTATITRISQPRRFNRSSLEKQGRSSFRPSLMAQWPLNKVIF